MTFGGTNLSNLARGRRHSRLHRPKKCLSMTVHSHF